MIIVGRARLWLALSAGLIWTTRASAQLAVSPVIVDTMMAPGTSRVLDVKVANSSTTALNCSVTLHHMDVVEAGRPVVSDSDARSCRDWIEVKEPAFALPPSQSRRLSFSVKVPRGISGGYYAMLGVSAVPADIAEPDAQPTGARIRLSYLNYVPILLTIPGPTMKAILDPQPPTVTAKPDGGLDVAVAVRNKGTLHARLEGAIEFRSETGLLLDRVPLSSGYLLPDHERTYAARGDVRLPDGSYQLVIAMGIKGQSAVSRTAVPVILRAGQAILRELTETERDAFRATALGFIVGPRLLGVRLPPGSSRTLYAELVNTTSEKMVLQATGVEWVRNPAGADECSDEAPLHHRSLKPRLELRQPIVELPPRSQRRVPISIALPKDSTGELYAAVQFERVDRPGLPAPQARARRSVLLQVYAEKTAQPAVNIDAFTATPNLRSGIDLVLRVTNTGNVSLSPVVSVTITDDRGQQVDTINLPPGSLIQAGMGAVLQAQCTKALAVGVHRFLVSVGVDERSKPETATVTLDLAVAAPPAAAATEPKVTQP